MADLVNYWKDLGVRWIVLWFFDYMVVHCSLRAWDSDSPRLLFTSVFKSEILNLWHFTVRISHEDKPCNEISMDII